MQIYLLVFVIQHSYICIVKQGITQEYNMSKFAKNKIDSLNGEYKLIPVIAKLRPSLYKSMRDTMDKLGINTETSMVTVALTKYIKENE
jgi:hypothetical protein